MKRLSALLVMLMLVISFAQAQSRQVTGTVTGSDDGMPLPGVSIQVKGTVTGGTTDMDGKYSLNVPANATLVFSFVGFKPQEVQVGDRSIVNVILESESQKMEEVVVTALGISREKKSLGYAVEDVKGSELARSGENNVINTLSGKVAGIEVISSGGTPGASTKILIRGNSSFTGENQPLIVVDGVPIDNSTNTTVAGDYPYNANLAGVNNSNRALDINPDDVESVTVLKGPSAAALYGAKAANGAIVYTTKKGRAGQPRVTYGFNADFDVVSKLPEEQKLYTQGTNGVFTGSGVNSWGAKYTDVPGLKTYNNTSDFFNVGAGYTHNVSIVGGDNVNSFRLSLSRLDQAGIIPTTSFNRTTARISTSSKITDALTFNGSVSYTNSGGTMAQNGSNVSGIMLALMRAPINFNLSDYQNPDGSSNNYYPYYDNPYWSLHNNPFKQNVDRVFGNFGFKYDITKWLNFTYKLGLDVYADKRKQVFAIGSNGVDDLLGEIDENTIRYKQYYQDGMLNADYTFFEKLTTSLSVGGNLTHNYSEQLFGRGTQLTIPGFYNLSSATNRYADESLVETRTSAAFFDLNLGWDNYLFVNATGRNEWSSTFGDSKNNFFYPSLSGSFVFSEFIPKNRILSFGKLRAAIAQGGNSPGAYSTRTYYTNPAFADGYTNGNSFPFLGLNGYSLSGTLGNPNLKPEKSQEIELGLELKFLDNRIGTNFTVYNKESSDILVARPVAGSSGFAATVMNSGKMRNRGVEIVAYFVPVKLTNFTWRVDANFSKNVNKVLDLAEGVNEVSVESAFTAIGSYAIKGQPYGVLYGTKWLRNDKGQLVIGANGLPEIDPIRGRIGNPYPNWTAGIRSTFDYKGFSLSALLDIRNGGDEWCGTIARMNRLGRTAASADRDRTYIVPGVMEDGTPNTTPISALNYFSNVVGDGSLSATENSVFSTSWLRLREVSLSYRLDTKVKSVPWLKFVEVTVIGRNLWLKTDYPGVDPETSLTGAGSNLTGFDYFNNPGTKTYSFGIKLGIL